MKRHEKMTAPRLLEAVYKRPGQAAAGEDDRRHEGGHRKHGRRAV